jgi:nitroreductase
VEFADVIRGRRTVKAFGSEPVPRDVLEELFELARWAPNHGLTNPWRFRVLGPQAIAELSRVAGEQAAAAAPEGADPSQVAAIAAAKLARAQTLIVVSCVRHADPVQHDEDVLATACATYVVLLAAHDRGLAAYWRTPAVLRTDEGLATVGVGAGEQALGLVYLGPSVGAAPPPPPRAPVDEIVTWLD